MAIEEQGLTILSMVASSFGAVGSLGWWLSGRFRAVEQKTADTIDQHEHVDNRRHEENLARFSELKIEITKLGGRHRA